jgi:hypothetical protein
MIYLGRILHPVARSIISLCSLVVKQRGRPPHFPPHTALPHQASPSPTPSSTLAASSNDWISGIARQDQGATFFDSSNHLSKGVYFSAAFIALLPSARTSSNSSLTQPGSWMKAGSSVSLDAMALACEPSIDGLLVHSLTRQCR